MNKTEKAIISIYKNACAELAELINQRLFDGCRNPYWIGDVVGGICDFDGTDTITADDMVLIIENNMTYEQYAEWRNANLDNGDKYINLKSWLMGLRHDMLVKSK